jgi:hypothetical protein
VAVPRVLEYLTDVAYHRYAGVSSETVAAIAARANQLGLRTAMLEHIESDYHDLHEDLRLGQNSAWQQFTLAYCAPDNGAQYYFFDEAVASSTVTMGSRTRYFRQYFPFIRLNARRIGAVSGDNRLEPLAFRNADGKVAVVVKAARHLWRHLHDVVPILRVAGRHHGRRIRHVAGDDAGRGRHDDLPTIAATGIFSPSAPVNSYRRSIMAAEGWRARKVRSVHVEPAHLPSRTAPSSAIPADWETRSGLPDEYPRHGPRRRRGLPKRRLRARSRSRPRPILDDAGH